MKLLLLKSTALAALASSGAYAYDKKSTSLTTLRGSKLVESTDEFEEIQSSGGVCQGTDALSSKNRHGQSKSQVCRRDYGYAGQYNAYKCTGPPGYACCNSSAGQTVSTQWGTCTKSSGEEDEDMSTFTEEFEETQSSGVCQGTDALSSKNRHGQSKSQVCRRDYGYAGQYNAYKCTGPPGYACCKSSAGQTVSTQWGTCTKSSGEEDEDEDMSTFTDEFGEVQSGGVCQGTDALSSKNRHGQSKGQICRRDYGYAGQYNAYKCTGAPGYACCKSSAPSSVDTQWGTCTKSSGDAEEDENITVNESMLIRTD